MLIEVRNCQCYFQSYFLPQVKLWQTATVWSDWEIFKIYLFIFYLGDTVKSGLYSVYTHWVWTCSKCKQNLYHYINFHCITKHWKVFYRNISLCVHFKRLQWIFYILLWIIFLHNLCMSSRHSGNFWHEVKNTSNCGSPLALAENN